MNILARKVGIDLGSSRCRIIVPKRGIVLDQPSIVARDQASGKIVAVGDKALEMAGKTPETITTDFPLKRGVIADFGATAQMLRAFMIEAAGRLHISKPEVMISVSMTATSTEQRAVINAGESAGAQRVHLIQPPVAAALGAKVAITEPRGSMIIDIGAGTTEIAVISLGGIVTKRAIRIGGRTIDDVIVAHMRRKHGIVIGPAIAKEIKEKIGHLGSTDSKDSMPVSGRSSVEGLPKTVTLHARDTHSMISGVFDEIIRTIRSVIEVTSPELVADIKKNGILLSGGTAKMNGLEDYLSLHLNTACNMIEAPDTAVVKGTRTALAHLDDYQKSLLSV